NDRSPRIAVKPWSQIYLCSGPGATAMHCSFLLLLSASSSFLLQTLEDKERVVPKNGVPVLLSDLRVGEPQPARNRRKPERICLPMTMLAPSQRKPCNGGRQLRGRAIAWPDRCEICGTNIQIAGGRVDWLLTAWCLH